MAHPGARDVIRVVAPGRIPAALLHVRLARVMVAAADLHPVPSGDGTPLVVARAEGSPAHVRAGLCECEESAAAGPRVRFRRRVGEGSDVLKRD